MRKRFVCGLLALALFVFTLPAAMAASSDVVYLGDAGSDGNSGLAPGECVKTWEKAYELLNDGGTIVVVGTSTVPGSAVPMAAKKATITGSYAGVAGGVLMMPADENMAGLSFGADTTVEHLTVDCSGNSSSYGMFSFYANGHNLTLGEGMNMLPFPASDSTPYPVVQASSANFTPEVPGYPPAACGTITVKSGQYKQINPGGFA